MKKYLKYVVPIFLIACTVFLLIKITRPTHTQTSLLLKSENQEQSGMFSDQNLGISFSYPKNLMSFAPREMSFRECPDCPDLIHISAEETDQNKLSDALKNSSFSGDGVVDKQPQNKTIAGESAIVLVRPDGEQIFFVIHRNLLYRLSVRGIDPAKLLASIQFLN